MYNTNKSNLTYILFYNVSKSLGSVENFDLFDKSLMGKVVYKLQIKNNVSKI